MHEQLAIAFARTVSFCMVGFIVRVHYTIHSKSIVNNRKLNKYDTLARSLIRSFIRYCHLTFCTGVYITFDLDGSPSIPLDLFFTNQTIQIQILTLMPAQCRISHTYTVRALIGGEFSVSTLNESQAHRYGDGGGGGSGDFGLTVFLLKFCSENILINMIRSASSSLKPHD